MSRYKFRGFSKHGYFVHGLLTTNSNYDAVIEDWFDHGPTQSDPCGGVGRVVTIVDPETVGQFTGLTDKNGVDIYEGDIASEGSYGPHVIEWGQYGWAPFEYDGGGETRPELVEIIGNIYENPELMEQQQ